MNIKRVVIWFSAGVTSAVAAKIALNEYGEQYPCIVAICDTGSEHADNWRFTDDVSEWLGVPILRLKNEKYGNVDDVFLARKYLKNQYGAPCTLEMKKKVRRQFENVAHDLQIFGYDARPHEITRAQRFNENNPEVMTYFPLIAHGITHDLARQILVKNNIVEPITYQWGFNNANCLDAGCVKGGIGYWNHIRRVLPEVFWRRARLERMLGFAMLKESDGTPLYLDELDPTRGNYDSEPAFQCGLFCGEF